MTVASEIIAFIINSEIILTEGLLLRFLRVIEQFVRVSPVKRYYSYRVLVFPNFVVIAYPECCTEWFLSETEPLEDIVQRFQRGGLASVMTTPPKVVKLGTSQVIQPPRMRSQAQIVGDSGPEQEEEVHMAAEYIVP